MTRIHKEAHIHQTKLPGKGENYMSGMNCLKRAPLRLSLLLPLLALIVHTPLAAGARNYTVHVPAPNHVDDTANLQAALDDCVRIGPNCTVQLAAGKYLTKQLVAYNFRGSFKGKGKSKTIVEALPELDVSAFPKRPSSEFFECKPNITDCSWPTLILFVDADIRISDMSIKITAVPSTKPWFFGDVEYTALTDAMRFTGQDRTNASLERVAISGMHDDSDTSYVGFNVSNGVMFSGEFPRSETPLDYYFLRGTLTVSNSSFNTMLVGTGTGGFIRDSRVVIGGSPAAGNVFVDLGVGVDLESFENSIVEVSHNAVATSAYAGSWVVPWFGWLPTKPSLFLIHNNKFMPAGPDADGIFLGDDPTNKWIYALIYNNVVEAQDIGFGGISAYSTKGTTIVNNKISGNGGDGIEIGDGTHVAVLGNNVTNFTAAPDLAQIVLDGTTIHSTVVCKTPNDTVQNLGTDNKLIGCQAVSSSANSSKLSSRSSKPRFQRMPKGKPPVR
jgi:parallel beta-helix repeat protein